MNQPETWTAETGTGPQRARVAAEDGRRVAPATDPTNPCHQEAAGIFTVAGREGGPSSDEPGLTEEDRVHREPGH